ncbi:hypothetical protein HZR00_00735 [Elizabethkingia anophelis]|nr:hypothetical protein [Elizabethkingia anophelis]
MPQDILFNPDYSLKIENGDFVIGESTYQHQRDLLFADKGEFKESPTIGVGSRRYLESEKPSELAREIRLEFIADRMDVNAINIDDNLEISIDAAYRY